MKKTTLINLDQAVQELAQNKSSWVSVDLRARIHLLQKLRTSTLAAAEEWVRESCTLKSIDSNSALSAEEWFAGPLLTIRNMRLLENTLRELLVHGKPQIRGIASG